MCVCNARLAAASLQQEWDLCSSDRDQTSFQLMTFVTTTRLAFNNIPSLPAGSSNHLAAIMMHCLCMVDLQQTEAASMPTEVATVCHDSSYQQMLAWTAVVTALASLGTLHKVLSWSNLDTARANTA